MSLRDRIMSVIGETIKREKEAKLKEIADNKKCLTVKINLWPERGINGKATHPENKSNPTPFENAKDLIGVLEKWNANVVSLKGERSSKTREKDHKGLACIIKLEPFTNGSQELSGIITNADDQNKPPRFSNSNELISIINRWLK